MGEKCRYIGLVLSLVVCVAYAQQPAVEQYKGLLASEKSPSEKFAEVERLFVEIDTIDPQLLSNLYYDFAKWNWVKNNNQKQAKRYAKKEFELRKDIADENNDLIKRNLYNLGYMHHHSATPEYYEALAYFDTLLAFSNNNEVRIGNVYRERGDIYDALGDFQRALENYSFSERIFKLNNRADLLFKTYINISATYVNLSDSSYLEPFLENIHKISEIESNLQISEQQQAMLLFNTGAMYNTTENYQRAFEPTFSALEKFQQINDSVNTYWTLSLLGVLHTKDRSYKEAKRFFEKSEIYAGDNKLLQSGIKNNIADLFLAQMQYDKAIAHYVDAIILLTDRNTGELPDMESIRLSPFKKYLLEYLTDIAKAFLIAADKTGDRAKLSRAEDAISLADRVVDELFFESREELSKLSWRKKAANLYLMAVSVCYRLDVPERALYFMEKNRGMLLLERINNVKARQYAGIPVDILEREQDLLSEIKELQIRIAKSEASEISLTDSLKNRTFRLKREYGAFVDSLEQSYPSYYRFKQQLHIVSAQEVRESLKENHEIVAYIMGDDLAYALRITNSEIRLKSIEDVSALKQNIDQYRAMLEKPFSTKTEMGNYQHLAAQIYSKLFPFEDWKDASIPEKVTIIPDDVLQFIPFEALTTSTSESLIDSYFLNYTNVNYKYSLSLDAKLELLSSSPSEGKIAFLPTRFANNYVNPLLSSVVESEMLSSFFGNEIVLDTNATKDQFLKAYDTHSVIHISTHGGIGNDAPWLAFYDKSLSLDELYFLKNKKKMVVLSACKTSIGEKKQGEGLFSLTRGFFNSGAKSVLATLWNVNEKSSMEIISKFYESAFSGKSKSEALRQAKLHYLELNENTSEASPYYWSPMIITGNDEPLNEKTRSFTYIALASFLGIGLLLFFRYKRSIFGVK